MAPSVPVHFHDVGQLQHALNQRQLDLGCVPEGNARLLLHSEPAHACLTLPPTFPSLHKVPEKSVSLSPGLMQ